MSLESDYRNAFADLKAEGYSDDEADSMARQFVVPAGDTQYSTDELINLGGFIGDPNKPGSNVFSTAVTPNGISGYSPAPVSQLPPWMVQTAGQANELPGRAAIEFQEAYGVDLNPLYSEREVAVGTLKGMPGEVPKEKIDQIDKQYKDAIDRYQKIVQAGADPAETESVLFAPLRSTTKSLVAETRYREPSVKADPFAKELWSRAMETREAADKAAQGLNMTTRGVEEVVPASTNVTRSLFSWPPFSLKTNVTPPSTQWTNAFTPKDIYKAGAKLGAAQAARDAAMKEYMDYSQKTGKPFLSMAGGGQAVDGASPASTRFGSEEEARSSGAQSGDIVYIVGVGKVRLR